MKKTTATIFTLLIALMVGGGILLITFKDFVLPKSEFDIPNKPNDKIIGMLNTQIEKQIEDHTQSTMHPGYIPESRQNTINFLKKQLKPSKVMHEAG